ncbi:MAG: hypothetical protein A2487_07265 [Candidatus Raymondbacteria bacterium RifOxyC12_full_50_8]|uniref:histidine kinase n=1 Tax=Candidatus Raymondbacteria bacterium RIFOXYD12_FULL_49_13 TaxID=1817890 RepID=A0A1F7F3J1_UNCRA|nr:MAG: hypothetical protein A2248_08905 [Candidatus Raymondbacteria bacterium RIFOXYA2_FULL_49_16]OGJ96778.1 MAG: hypothetical protein A2487_07265 [Candidatus Raymondbacteria bacterium RifOxyC12_full_50_8]OGK01132.1 MAG: hypothetical protein A2519_20435 [Candidatus Raymondbacteria bacterium RIFOXYD12_FULL_49_13]OGP39353.1 MAG: hypothetical protein A2324_16945 [Candidatus Raymondbacteria bacterium RIFOXYB2_FULL_49_35]
MKNISLRTKTFVLLFFVVLCATVPLIIFYTKAAQGLAALGADPAIETNLAKTIDLAPDQEGKKQAALALKKYRQIGVLKQGIIRQVLVFSVFFFAFTIVVTLTLGFFFTSRITKPLSNLTAAIRRLAGDDAPKKLKDRAGGEIGVLIESFNKMAADLASAREQRAMAERRATWQHVARTIAHEIKNPLTPIRLSTERMYDKFLNASADFPDVIKSTTTTILHEIENLQKLVDSFHKYAKFPDPALRREKIDAILGELVPMLQTTGVDLSLSCTSPLPEVMIDKGQIREAFTNLIKNAIQAIQEKGGLGAVRVVCTREDLKIVISVEDNGAGIQEENMKRLFQPYFTTKKHGSGIGLALTERIINLHGGTIAVRSHAGQGTVFTLNLPLPPETGEYYGKNTGH